MLLIHNSSPWIKQKGGKQGLLGQPVSSARSVRIKKGPRLLFFLSLGPFETHGDEKGEGSGGAKDTRFITQEIPFPLKPCLSEQRTKGSSADKGGIKHKFGPGGRGKREGRSSSPLSSLLHPLAFPGIRRMEGKVEKNKR